MRRALITGISGQDGRYLGEQLTARGYSVYGTVRDRSSAASAATAELLPQTELIEADLTDPASLHRALDQSAPDEVYNLASFSSVGASWRHPALTAQVTAIGAVNLLEATRLHAGGDVGRVRYFQASSAEMFGDASESPQHERTAMRPRSPYGAAKLFAHHLTASYRESYGMHASSGILFNHESPRRGTRFVTRKISQAVARISLGLQRSVHLGNLDARRDWGFAGDYTDAMWRMLQQPSASDYVIATGHAHSVRQFVAAAFAAAGIEDWQAHVEEDPALLRPTDSLEVIGDASRARNELGWAPTVDFDELVRMMVASDAAEQARLHR
jgi:GDPmannose 4,6-dehydratase